MCILNVFCLQCLEPKQCMKIFNRKQNDDEVEKALEEVKTEAKLNFPLLQFS